MTKAREYSLKYNYGITLDQYDELLEKQDHKCFICSRHKSEFKINLAVDHNHETGEIRGLLCTHCNQRVVGRMKDPAIAYRLYEYLSQGTGWIAPKRVKKRKKRVRRTKAKTKK